MSRTASSIVDLNVRIAQALGIDLHNVVGFHLRCWAGEVPRLRITKHLIDGTSITRRTDRFKVLLLDEPPPAPFDLNAECFHAIAAVQRTVDRAYSAAHDHLRHTFERRLDEISAALPRKAF